MLDLRLYRDVITVNVVTPVDSTKSYWRNAATTVRQGYYNLNWLFPLSPNIHMQILQTDLYTFPLRISYEHLIKDHWKPFAFACGSFYYFSQLLMMYAHCQEKIDFGCSWELTYCTFHKHTNSEVQKPTGVCIICCRQSSQWTS